MPSKEVVTFWLDMGAPMSLLSRGSLRLYVEQGRTTRQLEAELLPERPCRVGLDGDLGSEPAFRGAPVFGDCPSRDPHRRT